jgi:hypothetical protein
MTMRMIAVMFTCFATILAFGFLLSGYVAVLQLDDAETDKLQRGLDKLPRLGFSAMLHRHLWLRRNVLPLSSIAAHWRTRPEARKLVWFGLGFLLVALALGQLVLFHNDPSR